MRAEIDLVQIGLAIVCFFIWLVRLEAKVNAAQKEIKQVEEGNRRQYDEHVKSMNTRFDKIDRTMERIEDKLDRKADKPS